jgi:transcription initiation factor TFIIIB Brf1 subunit/transcription initiation factor TFIIB
MVSDYVNVTKVKICPACGATNRIRYEFSIMMIEAPCSSCGVIVKWKRKTPGSGGQIKTAFDDDEPELARTSDHQG